jgi:hypothetical protein
MRSKALAKEEALAAYRSLGPKDRVDSDSTTRRQPARRELHGEQQRSRVEVVLICQAAERTSGTVDRAGSRRPPM